MGASAFITRVKHKKFAQEVVKNGGNATQAYAKVYPLATQRSAEVAGSELLKKIEVQKEILSYRDAIAQANPPKSIARDLRRMRKATKKIWHEGEEIGEDADHSARNAALKMILQTQGALEEDKHALPSTPIINFNFIQASATPQESA